MNYPCAAVAVLACLSGCLAPTDTGVHVIQPTDLPIPKPMQLKTYLHRSNSLEIGEYRYADLVYEGRMAPIQLASYLIERMPHHSYRLVTQEKTLDRTEVFVFERGPYTAKCSVRDTGHRTRLEIRLRTHPKL